MPLASRLLLIAEAEIVKGLTENYLSEWNGFRRACAYAGRSVLLLRPRNDLLLALSHYSTGRERDTSLFFFFFALMSIGTLSSHYEDPAYTFPHAREVPSAFPARNKPFCLVDQSGHHCITTMGSPPVS